MTTPSVRSFAAHQPAWQRFQTSRIQVSNKSAAASASSAQATIHPYQRQYAHVYHQRLAVLGPRCWESVAASTDGDSVARVDRILELKEGIESIAVGTLVKQSDNDDDKDKIHPDTACRTTDTLYLEDESGRVALDTDQVHEFCTGVVVAVQGTVGTDGVMRVDQFYPPSLPPPYKMTSSSMDVEASSDNGDSYVMLVSGLQCGSPNVSTLPRDLLLQYLEGRLGVASAQQVCRVVLAGGLCDATNVTAAVKELDGFVLQIAAAGVPVDVLPGKSDPTTANWPQRPLHRSLLKSTHQYFGDLVSCTPNPYAAVHDKTYVVGTDGTNVHDLRQHVLQDDKPVTELRALQKTIRWSHVCPTGPDVTPTMPHAERDPMVLEKLPDVFFGGTCDKFDMCTYQGVRLVCVPNFAVTGQVVLVNVNTNAVQVLRFEQD